MKKQKTTRSFNVLMRVMLLALLALPTIFMTDKVQAAEKPSIETTMTIGTGSIRGDSVFYSKNDLYNLEVYNPVKKATYSFTSSNEGVVTVKSKGAIANLTGVKAGTATITCQQKYNGKTTKIGTCKVTVKYSEIFSESYDGLPVGTSDGYLVYHSYRNNDATYTYTSKSKYFTMKENVVKEKESEYYAVTQSYTATKAGTYTVTVKETYNKKTRTVGEIKFIIKKATVFEVESIYLGESLDPFRMINLYRYDISYYFETDESDLVEFYKEDNYLYLRAKNVGAATIRVYEDADTSDDSKYIGSFVLTVKDTTLEGIDCYYDSTETYVGASPIGVYVQKTPYAAPDTIAITSSDPSIATVSDVNEYLYAEITPVGEGAVTITITCGELIKTTDITVYADEYEMYGW